MILLSFTSATKYILGLMLAMLGIIPFEDVQPTDWKSTEANNTYAWQSEKPLSYIPVGTYTGQDFQASCEKTQDQPKFISIWGDYPMECKFPERQLVATFRYEAMIEDLKQHDDLEKILIIYCNEAVERCKDKLVIIESGI